MAFKIKNKATDKSPKYIMISDLIKKEISGGSYQNGDKLPSCRDLAANLNASYLTVINAIKLLENEGIISSVPGKGNFIADKRKKESPVNVRTGFLMDTKGDLYQNFFNAVAREFEKNDTYLVPLNSTMVQEGLPEEELIARIEKYASMSIENLVILGQRHFPYKYFNEIASKFKRIVYTIHYDADQDQKTPGANIIIPDLKKAGQIAAEHLLENGWKQIAFITYEVMDEGLRRKYGTSKYTSDMLVMDGIEDVLRKHGTKGLLDVINDNPHNNIRESDEKIKNVLSQKKPAFVALGDSRYKRILNIAEKMGLKEGVDFGFVGMYNTPWAEAWNLSSISIREDELARLTVQAIIENWKNKTVKVEPELIVRKK